MLFIKRIHAIIRRSVLSLMGLSPVSCRPTSTSAPVFTPHQTVAASAGLVTAHNDFGWQLFAMVTADHPQSNVFISPIGISIALHMVYNGATGTTQQAMAQTLRLSNLSLPVINSKNATLLTTINNLAFGYSESPNPNSPELSIANSLWTRPAIPLKPEFVQTAQQYHAQVSQLSDDPAPINQWVAQQTHGKIASIVGPGDIAGSAALLVNAVYFKGAWEEAFVAKSTLQEPFYPANGPQRTCAMMHLSAELHYQQGDHFQALILPYAHSTVSMFLLLPDLKSSVEALIRQLSEGEDNQWLKQFHLAMGDVSLPRFTLRWEVELKEALTALGMGEAFSPTAHFDAMASDFNISNVMHKTYVKVDEKGTEAAAVTGISFGMSSPSEPLAKPFRMIVNRPFLCAIADSKTGAILFLGAIYQPDTTKD